jgi:hypothetical protein
MRKKGNLLILLFLTGMVSLTIMVLLYQQKLNQQAATQAPNVALIDNVVAQTLTDMNTNGWDTTAANTGILVNWRRDDHTKVNCGASACDPRGNTTRHDPINDLRDLENLYWYRSRHPGDTAMNQYISRIAPVVQAKSSNSNLDKGWIYYTFLRMAKYGDLSWDTTAQHWAASIYSGLDPALVYITVLWELWPVADRSICRMLTG